MAHGKKYLEAIKLVDPAKLYAPDEAAQLAKEEVCCFEHGDQGGTFNGNPLMTAVGVAIMQTLVAPGFLDNVRDSAAHLSRNLASLADEFGMTRSI